MIGQRIDLSLDGFQPDGYPGGESQDGGRVHRVLFHFAASHEPGESEHLHFGLSRRVKAGAPFRYLDQPIFVGLTVGEEGLDLRYLTVPLQDPCDVSLFEALSSETDREGLELLPHPQPAAALASRMAFRMTRKVIDAMNPVHEYRLGLHLGGGRGAPLRSGTYVIAQVPSAEQLAWDEGRWAKWRLHVPSGQIVARDDGAKRLPFNYVLLTVDPNATVTVEVETGAAGATAAGGAILSSNSSEPSPENRPTRASPFMGRRSENSPCDEASPPGPGQDADLAMTMWIESSGSKHRLMYSLASPIEELGLFKKEIAGPLIEGSAEAFQEKMLRRIEKLGQSLTRDGVWLSEREVRRELASLGQGLYRDLFSKEMRRVYREVREKVCRIRIVSAEPYIPWELVKPYETDGGDPLDDDFLCLRFEFTRWLSGENHPAAKISVDALAAVHAGRVPGFQALENADDEYALIKGLAARRQGIKDLSLQGDGASWDSLTSLLESGEPHLLHVIGHGDFDPMAPEEAAIYLPDKRRFTASDLVGPVETGIQAAKPFVFLNSCLGAQQSFSLTGLGGWAPALVRAGCGAFLGSQWSIKSTPAFQIARHFYAAVEEGVTIPQAVRRARLAVRKSSLLAALSPVFYGHPTGRLTFGK